MSTTNGARPIGDVLSQSTIVPPRDAAIIADVHALAAAYVGLPAERRPGFLVEVRKLTTGYDRFRATSHTPSSHPMFGPLMAMLDGLIATDERVIVTDRGMFDRSELAAASAAISPTKVVLPVSVKGGEAIYPTAQTAGPNIMPFRVGRPEEVRRAPSMWGDDE